MGVLNQESDRGCERGESELRRRRGTSKRDVQVLDERGYTSFWIEGQVKCAALTPGETGNAPGVRARPSTVPDDDEYANAAGMANLPTGVEVTET